jgi:two-component system copper resistance phosphate regulon response regulator CusR
MIPILLAEDEFKLAQSVKSELLEHDIDAEVAFDGNIAERLFISNQYQLVILDVNLPFQNGFELCKKMRQHNPEIPIIMLTALGEIEDKMLAFESGADDYIVKPFHFKELIARIHVFLKRSSVMSKTEILKVGDLEVDTFQKIVKRDNTLLTLTTREFTLLELLMRANGRVLSKSEIMEKVWNINFETNSNTIEVYINFLRNKIDKPFSAKLIHTKPGFGYFLKNQNES